MNQTSSERSASEDSPMDLSRVKAASLLSLGLEKATTPVEELVLRLSYPDGMEWFKTMLEAKPLRDICGPVEHLRTG